MTDQRKAGISPAVGDYAIQELARAKQRIAVLESACRAAHTHTGDMRDAWQRGIISTHDGTASRRSNRNVEINVMLRAVLTAPEGNPNA